MAAPLDAAEVADYLVRRGTLRGDVEVAELAGGVSNAVFAASDGHRSVVLKQAHARLRVAEEWFAPPTRVLTEADALQTAARLTPAAVPALLDVDPDRLTLTVERAPTRWRDWRTVLLAGTVDPAIGPQLGGVLARWHRATTGGEGCSERVRSGQAAFEALRLEPFFDTVADREPVHGQRVRQVADRVRGTRRCLVHGDFSPKNVLVAGIGQPGLWVIDFEVAHVGDPHFDLAFLLAHLLLKSVHRPGLAPDHQCTAAGFLQSYEQEWSEPVDAEHLSDLVACLVLARVRGKSPVDYLDPPGTVVARAAALTLLDRPAGDVGTLFAAVSAATPGGVR